LSNQHIVEDILAFCHERRVKLAFAESLTGGALCAQVVAVPGASKVLLGSVVAYQTELKHTLLGVSEQLRAEKGAVDQEVAARMALGVQQRFALDLGLQASEVVAVSTTGVAGPDEQDGKPVGLVYLSIAAESLPAGVQTFELHLAGDRDSIREQVVDLALLKLREHFVI
jgi:nicotinamide-nucleotide amidase